MSRDWLDVEPIADVTDKDLAEVARFALWGVIEAPNPLIVLDIACEMVGLDPETPESRATIERVVFASFVEHFRLLRRRL